MKQRLITIQRQRVGPLPSYLDLAHRHLEKGQPGPGRRLGTRLVAHQVPIDLMGMVMSPAYMAEVDSLELIYAE